MPTSLQIVDASDVVLFDLNDASGAANPGRVQTGFGVGGVFALNTPVTEFTRFSPSAAPGGFTTFTRDPLVESSWRQWMKAPSYDALEEGVGTLQRLFAAGGIMKWIPDGSARTRHIDYEPSPMPAIYQGKESELHPLLHLFETPKGVDLVIIRQPYVRWDAIDPLPNLTVNPLLLLSRTTPGRPDSFSWSSLTNITAESISATWDAYQFDIATTGTRTLSSSVVSGLAPADVCSGQWEVSASDSVTARAALQITFLQSDGTTVTATKTGAALLLGSTPQRLTVTTDAAPALTAKAKIDLVFTNTAATAVTVRMTKVQLEKGTAPTLFRVGPQVFANDPATGRVGYVWIHGDVPAPVRVEAQVDSVATVTDIYMGARGNGGQRGKDSLALFGSGVFFLQAESGSLFNSTAVAVDANASPGTGNSAAQCTYASSPTTLARRVRMTTTTGLAALRGRFVVVCRLRSTAVSNHTVQLQWGPSTDDPPPFALPSKSFVTAAGASVFNYQDLRLGTITIPDSKTLLAQLSFELWSARATGTGNALFDFIMLVPAGRYGHASTYATGDVVATSDWLRSDPERGTLEHLDSSKQYAGPMKIEGQELLWLSPGLNVIIEAHGNGIDTGYTLPKTTRTSSPVLQFGYSPRSLQ